MIKTKGAGSSIAICRSLFFLCAMLALSTANRGLAENAGTISAAPLRVTIKEGGALTDLLAKGIDTYEGWRTVATYNSITSPPNIQVRESLLIPPDAVENSSLLVADLVLASRNVVTFTEEPLSERLGAGTDKALNADQSRKPNAGADNVANAIKDTVTFDSIVLDSDNTKEQLPTVGAVSEPTTSRLGGDDLNVVVKPGDTLSRILLRVAGTYSAIDDVADYNKLSDPDALEPGDVVVIPSTILPVSSTVQAEATEQTNDVQVVVQDGDSLSAILMRSMGSFHMLDEVARYNNLQSPDLLLEGSVITIPSALSDSKAVEWEISVVSSPESVETTSLEADSDSAGVTDVDDDAIESVPDTSDEKISLSSESPANETVGSEQFDVVEETLIDATDNENNSTRKLSFEIDGILAVETERFDTTFADDTPKSRNGSDLIQLRTNGKLNLTESSSVGAKLYNKPVDFPNRNEIFYFDTQDFYLAKLFYAYEADGTKLQIGKISVGDGFLGRTSTYYGNQITSKDYDEKIGINYFGDFNVSTYNLNYALSAFYDDTTRLSSSLEGVRERNRLEDDIPGRTDKLNNLFAGLSFGLGGSDSVYLGHAARSTQLEPFSHQDTWIGVSKTIYDGENVYARVVGDLIHRENGLENTQDTSVSGGIYVRGPRSSAFLSLETERDSNQFQDDNEKFAELIVVYDITDNFFIEAAAKYEDLITEKTSAQAVALIYYFEFDTSD